MRQTGRVVALSGDMETATVRFTRSDACGQCTACFRLGEAEADIELANTLHAQVGDVVYIELHERAVLQASAILYGIPVCALVLGAWLGSRLGDLYAALGGLLFAALSYFVLHAFEPKFGKMGRFRPRMTGFAAAESEEDR